MASVRDNLSVGKYENKVPYPSSTVPVNETVMTVREAREHQESERRRIKDQRKAWREGQTAVTEILRRDLEKEHDMTGHPKAEKLWSLAWDRHGSGFGDVISTYEELVELVVA